MTQTNVLLHGDEARTLYVKMDKLENAILCNMWNNILQRFHKTSIALQAVDLDLCTAVKFGQLIEGLCSQSSRRF